MGPLDRESLREASRVLRELGARVDRVGSAQPDGRPVDQDSARGPVAGKWPGGDSHRRRSVGEAPARAVDEDEKVGGLGERVVAVGSG